jgi:hypothetical protein
LTVFSSKPETTQIKLTILSVRPLSPMTRCACRPLRSLRLLPDSMLAIEGENLRELMLVVIDEVESGDWEVAPTLPD